MLIDNIKLIIKAGNGGNGAATLLRNGLTSKGGPDGGNGGNGGNIYFLATHNVNDLREFRYKKKITALNGTNGQNQKKFGKNASHITILVPIGTKITDMISGKVWEIFNTKEPLLFAHGGKGGRGNVEFKSATNQTPRFAEPGAFGEQKELLLEIRLIAEIGLIGLPNAGKSSLLSVLTNATPEIAAYPFTTLEPNIGMLGKHPIADIPGLIEGASLGKGLGTGFLRHIEKTKILLHCIDITIENPKQAYETIRKEFAQFNTQLLKKPEYILLNKIDLADEQLIKKVSAIFTKMKKPVLSCSFYNQKSIEKLKTTVIKLLK